MWKAHICFPAIDVSWWRLFAKSTYWTDKKTEGKCVWLHAKNRDLQTADQGSSVASPKFFWRKPNIFTLSEQQYFVWHTVLQSTKRQNMQEIFRGMASLAPMAAPMDEGYVRLVLKLPWMEILKVREHFTWKSRNICFIWNMPSILFQK